MKLAVLASVALLGVLASRAEEVSRPEEESLERRQRWVNAFGVISGIIGIAGTLFGAGDVASR